MERKTPDRSGSLAELRKWSSESGRLKKLAFAGQHSGKETAMPERDQKSSLFWVQAAHWRMKLCKAGQRAVGELQAERFPACTQMEGAGHPDQPERRVPN